ncbi:MAG: iron-containing alcohol dehydrogenase [Bradymonadaceae bacterium]|nr:iron-containing alcohol dehydrogenase [Lujinxingiaceae bacterium]
MSDVIAELLARFEDKLDTRAIVVGYDAISEGFGELIAHLPAGNWLVAYDENTWQVAGKRLAELLDAAGMAWTRYEVVGVHAGEWPMCDDAAVLAFERALEATGCVASIAVGSGTINDIVKLASDRRGLYMACVCTAPSMNGYTSGIAAVLSEGVKTTIACRAPRVIIADLDVMAESPYRMICSGLGDLMSKPVSNADWQLSALLNDSFHSDEAMAIIETGAAMLEGVAPRLPARDREAIGGLVNALMLSGLAMSVAGSSSPASGGEHLVSHYIDMTGHAFDLPCDFHGCQVGVGTLSTAFIYERLMALDPGSIDIEACVEHLLPWPDYRALLAERFGPLFEAVVKHAEQAYPTPEVLRARLVRLVENWDVIMGSVARTLRTKDSLEAELLEAHCPVRFAQLDVDRERAFASIAHSKDIRNRYTILHLAWELGHLDAWTRAALEELF